jgi:hypothetical protein
MDAHRCRLTECELSRMSRESYMNMIEVRADIYHMQSESDTKTNIVGVGISITEHVFIHFSLTRVNGRVAILVIM